MIPATPQRVVFFGVTGSGKSTAAQRYAAAAGLPLTSVDSQIGWLPGWVEREHAEQLRMVGSGTRLDHPVALHFLHA